MHDDKETGPAERDSWMTELPDKLSQAFSGTTARTFRTNPVPEISDADRSLWTDTPADRERKEQVICDVLSCVHMYLHVFSYGHILFYT